MRRQKLYTCSAIESLVTQLVNDYGYEMQTVREGCLGYGHLILWAPKENQYNFEIREVALNEWNSAHTIRRFSKASKRLLKEIEEAEAEEEEEYAS